MGPGFGLPGTVWESGLPSWFTNVLESDKFTRAERRRAAGLRGALAFPIRAGGECVAVIELFSRAEREPDPDLLVLTDALGTLIGEFVEGVRGGRGGARRARHARAPCSPPRWTRSSRSTTTDASSSSTPPPSGCSAARREEAVGRELAELVDPAVAARAPPRRPAPLRGHRRVARCSDGASS